MSSDPDIYTVGCIAETKTIATIQVAQTAPNAYTRAKSILGMLNIRCDPMWLNLKIETKRIMVGILKFRLTSRLQISKSKRDKADLY